jgi:glycerate kinase
MTRAWPPQRILLAPQSFKGSLDAAGVAEAISAGLRDDWPWPTPPVIIARPLADGGEGTLHALLAAFGGGMLFPIEVAGPMPGQRVCAEIGWLNDSYPTAIIEMAQAAGLPLVSPEQRDPQRATTSGVGELLRAALERGARRIFVGLGGSATNDGGAGMAQALGARLLDASNHDLPPGGASLADLARIDISDLDQRLQQAEIIGLTDVNNPLCGSDGASAVYGPQKGATPAQVAQLDAALAHYAIIVVRDLGCAVAAIPGAGAAGGLGAGLLAFTGARLAPGAAVLLDAANIDAELALADLVITGEGRLDAQSIAGKLTGTLAQRAQTCGIPVICVTGGLARGYEQAYDLGVTAIIVAADGPRSLADAMTRAPELIRAAVARAVRLWGIDHEGDGSVE